MPNLAKSGARIVMAGSRMVALESLTTITLLQQQPVARIVAGSNAGNGLFVHGNTAGVPQNPNVNVLALISEQSNPDTGDGLFQVNTWDASPFTGFAPNNPATAQLSYAATGTSPTTTAQWEGNTIGVYMQSSDRVLPPKLSDAKMMITPQVNFPANTVIFTGPTVTMYESLKMKIVTASGDSYCDNNRQFQGPAGSGGPVLVTLNADIFKWNDSHGPQISSKQDTNTGTFILNVGLGATGASQFLTVTDGTWSNSTVAPNAPYSPVAWYITFAQFQNALVRLQNDFGNLSIPNTDPTQYSVKNFHLNWELNFDPAKSPTGASLGFSVQDYLVYTTG